MLTEDEYFDGVCSECNHSSYVNKQEYCILFDELILMDQVTCPFKTKA